MIHFDAIALAYWIMDDGSSTTTGIILHTENFT